MSAVPSAWVEPTRLTSRSGYTAGYAFGLLLILLSIAIPVLADFELLDWAGLDYILYASDYMPRWVAALVLTLAGALGWLILPGSMGRKILAALVVSAFHFLWLGGGGLTGVSMLAEVGYFVGLALPLVTLLFWFVVRRRPGIAYLLILVPLLLTVLWLFFGHLLYSGGWTVYYLGEILLLWGLGVVLPAWLGGVIAARGARRAGGYGYPPQYGQGYPQQQYAPGYAPQAAPAYPQQYAAPGYATQQGVPQYPTQAMPVPGQDGQFVGQQGQFTGQYGQYPAAGGPGSTNTMAVLSLVFAFVASLLGVIFGHIARGQIRRTGEQGWGLATAGLIIGYIGIAVGVIALIVWFAVFARLMYYW